MKNKYKILAIQGSFRNNGMTAQMLNTAVDEAKRLGHEVLTVNLHEKNIDYCKGCRLCQETKECIFKNDDMADITKQIKEADVIILSSPVYWGNVPAIVKNMFDRPISDKTISRVKRIVRKI